MTEKEPIPDREPNNLIDWSRTIDKRNMPVVSTDGTTTTVSEPDTWYCPSCGEEVDDVTDVVDSKEFSTILSCANCGAAYKISGI